MPKFDKHIFICGNQRPPGHPRGCCDPEARAELQKLFKLKLAERGIKGTGSAVAHSFDHWGIPISAPVPGAVAVMDRRGGGHVALVSRITADGRVFYWNATGGQRGWREVEIRGRAVRYRVASGDPGG